jgi:hypothetical protein
VTRREERWLDAVRPHPVAGWAKNQIVYVRDGALADFPALYQGMVTRRRALVICGLFYGSRATVGIEHLEN